MTLLYTNPLFQEHITGAHPEKPLRLATIERHLAETGLAGRCTPAEWKPATAEQIARIHKPEYIESVRQFAAGGGGRIESDTVVSGRSFDVALLAAGAACDAVRTGRQWRRQVGPLPGPPAGASCPAAMRRWAFACSTTWPSPPARRIAEHGSGPRADRRLGRASRQRHAGHVLGGSARSAFFDPPLAVLSRHRRRPTKPAAAAAWAARSTCRSNSARRVDKYHAAVPRGPRRPRRPKSKPQLVLISAGFDAHREDPIGSLRAGDRGFRPPDAARVQAVADEYAGGRIVSVLEGGYNPKRLAESVGVHLSELLEAGGC